MTMLETIRAYYKANPDKLIGRAAVQKLLKEKHGKALSDHGINEHLSRLCKYGWIVRRIHGFYTYNSDRDMSKYLVKSKVSRL